MTLKEASQLGDVSDSVVDSILGKDLEFEGLLFAPGASEARRAISNELN